MGTYVDETAHGRKHPIEYHVQFAHHIIDTDRMKRFVGDLSDRHEVRAHDRLGDEVHCTWVYTSRGANRDDVARVVRRWFGDGNVVDDILKLRPMAVFVGPRGKGKRLCNCEKPSEPCEDVAYEW